MKIIKRISAAIFAAFIGTAFSVSVFAAPEESSLTSEESIDTSAQTSTVQESSKEVSDEGNAETGDKSEKVNYDFSDKTIGNAVLTANENIITDDGNYQFIAATTRDGNVFYIIIDKLKTTDNVYFLNQVDTFDLQALLSSDNEDGEPVKVGADTVKKSEKDEETSEDGEEEKADSEEDSNSMNNSLLILGGIAVLAVGGFVFFKVKKGGFGKKKQLDMPLEDDFDDDDEINEDKE